jgi:hypothetical protein
MILDHIWAFIAAIPTTIGAYFAWREARATKQKTEIIQVQTNGQISRLSYRNAQLAMELSKHNIPIPPPLEGFDK